MMPRALLAITLASLFASAHGYCTEDACYIPTGQTGTFDEGQALCEDLGLHLARVRTADENARMFALFRAGGTLGAWIALHDPSHNGTWTIADADGAVATYLNWAPGQPNNWGGNQYCALFHGDTDAWGDGPCDEVHCIICEEHVPSNHPSRILSTALEERTDALTAATTAKTELQGVVADRDETIANWGTRWLELINDGTRYNERVDSCRTTLVTCISNAGAALGLVRSGRVDACVNAASSCLLDAYNGFSDWLF